MPSVPKPADPFEIDYIRSPGKPTERDFMLARHQIQAPIARIMKPPGRKNDKRMALDFFIPTLTVRQLLEVSASHLAYIFCPNHRHLLYPF